MLAIHDHELTKPDVDLLASECSFDADELVLVETRSSPRVTLARRRVEAARRAAAQAQRRLRYAELAVKHLLILLDEGRSGRINFTLIAGIVLAERRAIAAREALRNLDTGR